MIDRVQLVAAATSAVLFGIVIDLVRRKRLTEEYSLIWLAVSCALLAFSLSRNLLHVAARWLGVAYPPALLVLGVVGGGFVGLLYMSVVLSRQRREIERLVEEIGVLSAKVDDLEREARQPGP